MNNQDLIIVHIVDGGMNEIKREVLIADTSKMAMKEIIAKLWTMWESKGHIVRTLDKSNIKRVNFTVEW